MHNHYKTVSKKGTREFEIRSPVHVEIWFSAVLFWGIPHKSTNYAKSKPKFFVKYIIFKNILPLQSGNVCHKNFGQLFPRTISYLSFHLSCSIY